jgi:lysophospholipase L1-like esterase
VFLGDSITHQCLYTQYVEDFFLTRYPERNIHFHNAGVSGDKAADALLRFDDDVTAFHPKYVTLLLGMNDGQYSDFTPEIFDAYRRDMTRVLKKIDSTGAKAVVFTPTPFDHHQLELRLQDPSYRFKDREFSPQYNAVLGFYAGWLRETAGQRRLPCVDLWGPLNDFTFTARRTDPDFTLVPDAIHPGEAGQFIMAYSLLSQFNPDRKAVSSISLSKRGQRWTAAGGATAGAVSDLQPLRVMTTCTQRCSMLPIASPLRYTLPCTLRAAMWPSFQEFLNVFRKDCQNDNRQNIIHIACSYQD